LAACASRTARRRPSGGAFAYYRAVAERLDEPLRARARRTLERWSADGILAEPYAHRWRALLDLPLDELAAAITVDGEAARDLRQCTPFAGVLTPRERWARVRDVR
jgi:hypothetical protein